MNMIIQECQNHCSSFACLNINLPYVNYFLKEFNGTIYQHIARLTLKKIHKVYCLFMLIVQKNAFVTIVIAKSESK